MRKQVTPDRRLAITLYYLASSSEYRTIANLFGVSITIVCACIKDDCEAITRRMASVISYQWPNAPQNLFLARGPLFRPARTTSRGGPGSPNSFGLRAKNFALTRQKIRRVGGLYPVGLISGRKKTFRNEQQYCWSTYALNFNCNWGLYPDGLIIGCIFLFARRWAYNWGGGGL